MIVPFFTNFSGNDDIKENPECMSYLITYNDSARALIFSVLFQHYSFNVSIFFDFSFFSKIVFFSSAFSQIVSS